MYKELKKMEAIGYGGGGGTMQNRMFPAQHTLLQRVQVNFLLYRALLC